MGNAAFGRGWRGANEKLWRNRKLIEDARNNALKKVNEELITVYWN
jgi:hypothetical protein